MNSQKRLLLTLKYLWEKTDEEHPATLKEIGEYLQHNGIETTRKTLQADINLLTGFGIDIICNHSTQNQYHIGERVFEVPEVKLLVDAVQSARFITAKKSKTLIKKLSLFVGEPQADILKRHLYVDHRLKAGNEGIYFTVDLFHQAIRLKKRVTFQYYYYIPNKKKELKHNGKVYVFSPFALIWNDDSYYVIGYSDSHQKITKFRIDRIYGMKISEKFAVRDGILTPKGKNNWTTKGVLSILTNEKYKGDALLQKTYIVDCISKKSKKNTGELPMYYVENNHPAIIERAVFDRVQEEVSRRNSKRKVKDVGTKTELGKYSSKYALTELLFCGNCGAPYRRTTWAKNGKKKIVWRCISRLDYGTKYCKNSPSIEEGVLQNAIAAAITRKAQTEGANVQRIREHIEMYLNRKGNSDLEEKQERLTALKQRIDELTSMDSESAQNGDFDELFESLFTEMYAIQDELEDAKKTNAKLDTAVNRIDEMTTVMYGLKNHPVEYDEQIVRQLISSIKVISAEQILILFKDGTEMTADL